MDNTFVVKNKLMQTFETGNIILDLMFGTLICSLITAIIGIINFKEVIDWIKSFKFMNSYETSIFMEYKSTKLSDSFKGILYYIDKTDLDGTIGVCIGSSTMFNWKQGMCLISNDKCQIAWRIE